MRSRIAELEDRRRTLLSRIEVQRNDLAWRAEQLRPQSQVASWMRRGPQSAANHPLAWLAGVASILMVLKPRRLLSWLPWLAGGLSLASKLTRVLRVINELRGLRSRPPR
jgi:hypothetical protein